MRISRNGFLDEAFQQLFRMTSSFEGLSFRPSRNGCHHLLDNIFVGEISRRCILPLIVDPMKPLELVFFGTSLLLFEIVVGGGGSGGVVPSGKRRCYLFYR